MGRAGAAVDDCGRALELDPAYAKAYVRRAAARQRMGEHEEAVRDLEKVIEDVSMLLKVVMCCPGRFKITMTPTFACAMTWVY